MADWVTERAVYIRVKRNLERQGFYLKINRSKFFIGLYGQYCSHDSQGNLAETHIDLEAFARALGVLAKSERMLAAEERAGPAPARIWRGATTPRRPGTRRRT